MEINGHRELYREVRFIDSKESQDTISLSDKGIDPIFFFNAYNHINVNTFSLLHSALKNRLLHKRQGVVCIEFPKWFQDRVKEEENLLQQLKSTQQSSQIHYNHME